MQSFLFNEESAPHSPSADGESAEAHQVHDYDSGTYRCGGQDGDENPQGGAYHRDDCRADDDALEAAEHPHGRQCGEDDQRGCQQGTHQVHGQYDDDCSDHSNNHVI